MWKEYFKAFDLINYRSISVIEESENFIIQKNTLTDPDFEAIKEKLAAILTITGTTSDSITVVNPGTTVEELQEGIADLISVKPGSPAEYTITSVNDATNKITLTVAVSGIIENASLLRRYFGHPTRSDSVIESKREYIYPNLQLERAITSLEMFSEALYADGYCTDHIFEQMNNGQSKTVKLSHKPTL